MARFHLMTSPATHTPNVPPNVGEQRCGTGAARSRPARSSRGRLNVTMRGITDRSGGQLQERQPMSRKPPAFTVIDRVVTILDAFTNRSAPLTLTDICRHTGLPLSTTYRLLSQLTESAVLERGARGGYRIGNRLQAITRHADTNGPETIQPIPTVSRFADHAQVLPTCARSVRAVANANGR